MDWERKLREQYAIVVRSGWLEQVLAQLHTAHPDLATWPETQAFEKIFTVFLFCDLNQAGAPSLPPNVKEMHKEVLTGKYVLQVDEVVNMAAAARERYTDQTSNRCLKLALTDGCQQVVGVEYGHLPTITWDCPAGSKLLLHNVPIRRGLLLLGPDNTALLGGQVERLEAARQRAVAAWNKPVVGRPGNAGPRDIFAEARTAAWAAGPPPGPQPVQPQQQPPQHAGPAVGQVANPGAHNGPVAAAPGAHNGPAGWSGAGGAGPPGGHGHAGAPGHAGAAGAMQQQQQPQHPQPWNVQQQHQQQQQPQANGRGAPFQQQQQQHNQIHQQQPRNGGGQEPPGGSQQWQQQQPQATLPRGLTPPTQALGPPGAVAGGAAYAAGFSGGGGNGGAAAAAGGGWPGPSASVQGRAGSTGGVINASGGGGGAGVSSGSAGVGRGSDAVVVLLTSSSESAGGGGSSHSSLDGSSPHVLQPAPLQAQQQQPPLASLTRLGSAASSGLLGGSVLPPAAPPQPGLMAAAATGNAAPTSSSGLLPPGPRAAAMQRPALPSPSVTSSGSAAAARKPALPLARSSPAPSGYMGAGGSGRGAGLSTDATAAVLRQLGPQGAGAITGMGLAGPAVGGGHRAGGDVEMVDLAASDDDGAARNGMDGAAAGGSRLEAVPLNPQARTDPWVRAPGEKARLEQPLDPPGGVEKRPRLSHSPSPEYGSRLAGGGAAQGPVAAQAAVQEEGQAADAEFDMEPDYNDDYHYEYDYGQPQEDPNPQDLGAADPGRHQDGGEDWAGTPSAAGEGPMALDDGTLGAPVGPPLDGAEWEPQAHAPRTADEYDPAAAAEAATADADVVNHAGMVLLCQVPDLLAACDPGAAAAEGDAAASGFPLSCDVFATFHQLEGDVALIEDGTAMLSARLTDQALEPLQPLLADVAPPDGLEYGRLGLDEIQDMADSLDPAVQTYGQELATCVMEYIRDFSGRIRLEYSGPPPELPAILEMANDGGEGPGIGGNEAGPGNGLGAGVTHGSESCAMYEQYLRDINALEHESIQAGDGQE